MPPIIVPVFAAVSWSAVPVLVGTTISWSAVLFYATIAYSIFSAVTAANQKDKLKMPTSRYSASEINNTYSNEGIVPIVYGGPILMGGNILWQSDPGTTVKRFIGLCVGEISTIENVQIDENDISTLSGCSYTAYTGTTSQTPDSRCDSIVKGLRDVAYLAITLTAGDKVSSNPVVTCQVTGRKIKTWSALLHSWDINAVKVSKNPVAIIRDYMLLSQTLGGCGIPSTLIDNESFGDASEICDESVLNGSGGMEARYELDIVIDTPHAVLDNLSKMLTTANMALIRSAGVYKIAIEQSGQIAVMAFTEDNITKESFSYGYGKVDNTPNKVGVEWFSALESKNPKRIAWAEDELDQEIHGVKEEKIEALGIIRQSQASRLAKKILYERKINDIWCEFESNMSAMHCEPMDIVSVTHSRPNWTAALFKIIEIEETEFGKAKYKCQAYNSSVLNDSYGSTFDDWDYGSPPNPYQAVTDVTNIALGEIGWSNIDGTWVIHIDVTWTAPATNRDLLRNYIIEVKKGNDNYTAIGLAPASATSYRVSGNLKSGETYYIRVKTMSVYDIISDGTVSNPITLIGKITTPSNVLNFNYTWDKDVELTWSNVTDSDLVGYEIRDENDNFGTDDAHLIYRGLANKKVIITTDRAPGTYYIKAINTSGKYSLIPGITTPVNTVPSVPSSINVDVLFNVARVYWTNVLDNDILYYDVYKSETNAWTGEEILLGQVTGKSITFDSKSPRSGTAQSGSSDTLIDLSLIGLGDDFFNGDTITIISGTGAGQSRTILKFYDATGKVVPTVNWTTNPDSTSKYIITDNCYIKVRAVDILGPGSLSPAFTVNFENITENMLGDNVVTARKIYVACLSAISANIGCVTAGTIQGVNIQTGSGGARVLMNSTGLYAYDASCNTVFEMKDGCICAKTLKLFDPACDCNYSYLDSGQLKYHDVLGNVPYIKRICAGSANNGGTVELLGWCVSPQVSVSIKSLMSYNSGSSLQCQKWDVYNDAPVWFCSSATCYGYCFIVHSCLTTYAGQGAECVKNVAFGTSACTDTCVCASCVRMQLQIWCNDVAPANYYAGCLCYVLCYRVVGAGAYCSCSYTFLQPHASVGELKSTQNVYQNLAFPCMATWEILACQTGLSWHDSGIASGSVDYCVCTINGTLSMWCLFRRSCVAGDACWTDLTCTVSFAGLPSNVYCSILNWNYCSGGDLYVTTRCSSGGYACITDCAGLLYACSPGGCNTCCVAIPYTARSHAAVTARASMDFISRVYMTGSVSTNAYDYAMVGDGSNVCVVNICQVICYCVATGAAACCNSQIMYSFCNSYGCYTVLDPNGVLNYLAISYN